MTKKEMDDLLKKFEKRGRFEKKMGDLNERAVSDITKMYDRILNQLDKSTAKKLAEPPSNHPKNTKEANEAINATIKKVIKRRHSLETISVSDGLVISVDSGLEAFRQAAIKLSFSKAEMFKLGLGYNRGKGNVTWIKAVNVSSNYIRHRDEWLRKLAQGTNFTGQQKDNIDILKQILPKNMHRKIFSYDLSPELVKALNLRDYSEVHRQIRVWYNQLFEKWSNRKKN